MDRWSTRGRTRSRPRPRRLVPARKRRKPNNRQRARRGGSTLGQTREVAFLSRDYLPPPCQASQGRRSIPSRLVGVGVFAARLSSTLRLGPERSSPKPSPVLRARLAPRRRPPRTSSQRRPSPWPSAGVPGEGHKWPAENFPSCLHGRGNSGFSTSGFGCRLERGDRARDGSRCAPAADLGRCQNSSRRSNRFGSGHGTGQIWNSVHAPKTVRLFPVGKRSPAGTKIPSPAGWGSVFQ